MKSAMSRSILKNSASSSLLRRGYTSECAPERKVAVLGAAGGIGQPLAVKPSRIYPFSIRHSWHSVVDVRLSAMSTPDLRWLVTLQLPNTALMHLCIRSATLGTPLCQLLMSSLFSQATLQANSLSHEEITALTKRNTRWWNRSCERVLLHCQWRETREKWCGEVLVGSLSNYDKQRKALLPIITFQ